MTPATRSNSRKWFAAGFLALTALGAGLWSRLGSDMDRAAAPTDTQADLGQGGRGSQDLVNPGEAPRTNQVPAEPSKGIPAQESTAPENPNDGWGHVKGTALINGLPLELGKLHWNDPSSQEQGYAPIEKGEFEFEAPVGEIKVTAWVAAHNGFTVPGHETNSFDELTKLSPLTVFDAKPNALHFAWLYDEVLMQGDALMVPSMRPLAHTGLSITGAGPRLRLETDAAGLFHAIVPMASNLEIRHISGGTDTRAPYKEGWTPLRVPDSQTIEISVRDGRTGEVIFDYDFFFRPSIGPGDPIRPWRRYRVGGALGDRSASTVDVDVTANLNLPEGEIDLLIYAPRQGLAPHNQSNLEVGPQAPRIEVTLQPGGTLAFTCEAPPATGLVNPGFDPDPILVVSQRMFDWKEPTVQAFGGHVDREAVIPRNLLFTRRIRFNMRGQAEVQGLPAGTYRVLHWREGLNWRSEPLEVIPGVTTNVQLTLE
ncbi:MAG: hypothetical protein JKY61_11820 [Planctomycetes bacterium]|nr:hypothetical protein [Planctomycetota bacterium]